MWLRVPPFLPGGLPAAWAGMAMLAVVDLGRNRLGGALPAAWGRLAFLRMLTLQANRFTGSLPEEWAQLPRLINL